MFQNVLFSKEDIERIKRSEDPELKKLVKSALDDAEAFLKKGLSFLTGYDDTKAVLSLCFAYHYTKDEKYFDLAYKVMKQKTEKENWIDPSYDPNKPMTTFRASLQAGHKCIDMSYCLAYFGELLSREDADCFAKLVYEKGIQPVLEDWVLTNKKIHALDTMGHNFWIYIISAAALATVVIKDHIPNAEECLEKANKAIAAWFAYKGNPLNAKSPNFDDGAYHEGPGYGETCSHEYMKYAIAYNNAFGKHPFDDCEIMKAIGKYHIHTFYCCDEADYTVDFGDCGEPYRDTQFSLILYGLGSPEIRWFARESRSPLCDKYFRMTTWDDVHSKEAYPPKELSAYYGNVGWATFRDSHERNSTMLAIKCGDTWNHTHADCAHFTLFRKGTTEIYDSGSPPGYSKPSYQKYYVTSNAHNVLLFNDKGQDYRDNFKNHTHLPGKLYNFVDEDGFRYVVADGTGPMSRYFRKHHRHFLWLEDFILIYDDVECYECGKLSFLLHAKEENCFRMLTPSTVTTHKGYINKSETPNDTYKAFNIHTDDDGHAKFVGIMVLKDGLSPVYEEIDGGCRITCGNTTVYINFKSDGKIMHLNCINEMDGVITDGIMLIRQGEKFGTVNGSIIREGGCSHLDTFARVTGWAHKVNNNY